MLKMPSWQGPKDSSCTDPADYFAPGLESYPNGWNLPGGGVQRGNVLNLNGAGDPLTPGYPANGE